MGMLTRAGYQLGIRIAGLAALVATLGCSRTPIVVIDYEGTAAAAAKILEENAGKIVEGMYPPEAPLPGCYSTHYELVPDSKNRDWYLDIEVRYAGCGSFILWATKGNDERSARITLPFDRERTRIRVRDALSPLDPGRQLGQSAADAIIPILFHDHTGPVEFSYETGEVYTRGQLLDGRREGDWTWWYPNGEVMKTASFRGGVLHGLRTVRPEWDGEYYESTDRFSGGVIQWGDLGGRSPNNPYPSHDRSSVKGPPWTYPSHRSGVVAIQENTGEPEIMEFTTRLEFPDGSSIDLWKSLRPVHVSWSPDDRYFAVSDHVAKYCTTVSVFCVTSASESKLVYQTPYSNSERLLTFYFDGWGRTADGIGARIEVFSIPRHDRIYSYVHPLSETGPEAISNIYVREGLAGYGNQIR